MRKSLLLSSVAALMAVFAQPAAAQGGAPSAGPPQATAPQNAGATLGEIVVTAQRFTETAQRTSLAIQVLSAQQLRSVTDVRQLAAVTPGVNISPAGNVMQTYVRGVGSGNATNQQEAAVSYNADGVFLSTTSMITPMMYDLERVEVLLGPQGTLYGRNASGGAVNIITTGASIGKTGGFVEGEVGNFSLGRFTGAVNIPVSDTFALRLAADHAGHRGYLSDGTDDQSLNAARVRGLWKPSSTISLKFGVDIAHEDQNGAGSSIDPAHNPTNDPFIGALDPRMQTGIFVPTLPFTGATACGPGTFNPHGTSLLSCPPNLPPRFQVRQASFFAQLDADLGFATLTVLPSVREEHTKSRSYIPGYNYQEQTATHERSLEVRLSNRTPRGRWVVGGYYYANPQHMTNVVRNDVFSQNVGVDLKPKVESYAFFGETTFNVVEGFRLILGARYTHETSDLVGVSNALEEPAGVPGGPTTAAFNPFFLPNGRVNPTGEFLDYYVNNHTAGKATTWKAGFEYDLRPDSLIFFTASRGFKGGGSYVDIPVVNSQFAPEFLTAYEFGSRNRFFDNTLQVNLEVFDWHLRNQQIPYVGLNQAGGVAFITANAAAARMYGSDLDITWRPTRADTIHVGGEWLHARYDSFVRRLPSLAVTTDTRCRVSGYVSTPGSLAPATLDCSGLPMQRAPSWSGSAGYQHTFDFEGAGRILFDTNMTFAGPRYTYFTFSPETHDKAYALWNTALTYTPEGAKYSVTAWARNLTDARVVAAGSQVLTPFSRDLLMPPRTYGATVRYDF